LGEDDVAHALVVSIKYSGVLPPASDLLGDPDLALMTRQPWLRDMLGE
jgi:hypothetical protein